VTALAIASVVAVVLLGPVAGPAAANDSGAPLDRFTGQRLTWDTCGPGSPEALRCTTVTVPRDYSDPTGATIAVAISRLPATDRARRRGVLLMNIGGPGVSGLLLPVTLGAAMGDAVRSRYDLIGFDPRFVGRSAPVSCGLNPTEQRYLLLPAQDLAADVRLQAGIAAKCARNGPALRQATTLNVARDLDVIRMALRERTISYLGYSYGTYLGAVYAQLFGRHADRVILDSNVDPATVWRDMLRDFGPSLERGVNLWAAQVARHAPEVGLGTTASAVRATYDDLVARADRVAVPVDEWRFDGQDIRAVTHRALRHQGYHPMLADLVRVAVFGGRLPPETRTWLLGPFAGQAGDVPTGDVPTGDVPTGDVPSADNRVAAELAFLCGDVAWPRDLERYRRDKAAAGRRYPLFGATYSTVKPCTFWPTRPAEPLTRIGPGNRAPGILLVQATDDVATPHRNARQLRRLLPHNSRLLTLQGAIHGGYLYAENACVDERVESYLVTGELPAADLTCPWPSPGRPGGPAPLPLEAVAAPPTGAR
jgi:pimeloyl-ACP methyl ester carboxylesterase